MDCYPHTDEANMESRRKLRNNRKGEMKLPITVRQAQKYVSKFSGKSRGLPGSLQVALSLESFLDFDSALKKLAQLASKDPNQVLLDVSGNTVEPENFADNPDFLPKGTDEVAPQSESPSDDAEMHGGDNASQEVEDGESQGGESDSLGDNPQSQDSETDEGSQGEGDGNPQDGKNRSDRDAPQSNGAETGFATSAGCEQGEQSQNPGSGKAGSSDAPTSELGGGTATPPMSDIQSKTDAATENNSSRDEELSESQSNDGAQDRGESGAEEDSQIDWDNQRIISNSRGEQIPAEEPQQQKKRCSAVLGVSPMSDCAKKWGKSFKQDKGGCNPSLSNNDNRGSATASLKGCGISPKLLKLCRQKLAALVSDSCQEDSPRRDYQEFCTRIKTCRNPQPARKEEVGRPVILILPDISGSCASFSEESVKVAKAASALGVQGADVVIATHYNGRVEEVEVNGKYVERESIHFFPWKTQDWFSALVQEYQVQVVISLGDWDASAEYAFLAMHSQVEKVIWLDNAYCSSRGTVQDRTKMALNRLKDFDGGVKLPVLRQKLVYKDGCKDAIAFVKNIN